MVSPPSLFGFEIRAERPVTLLRRGGGEGILHIAEAKPVADPPPGPPLVGWVSRGSERPAAILHRNGSRYQLRTPSETCDIDPTHSIITVSRGGRSPVWEECFAGIPALLCFQHRGDVPLHAAAVEIEGRALVLAAHGRGGKTTLALAFHSLGFRVLTEDLACIRPGPAPALLPGPPWLRVRPDTLSHVPEGMRVVARTPERTYLAIAPSRRGTGDAVPIAAIVLLRESTGDITLERVPATEAVRHLWPLSFSLPLDGFRGATFRRLGALVRHVPIWNLTRPLQRTALPRTIDALIAACAAPRSTRLAPANR
jgi:hypothetical protein